jgi:hypothetical protein
MIEHIRILQYSCGPSQFSPCLDPELFVCGKNCPNFDKLSSKCSSRKVQQNCAISF